MFRQNAKTLSKKPTDTLNGVTWFQAHSDNVKSQFFTAHESSRTPISEFQDKGIWLVSAQTVDEIKPLIIQQYLLSAVAKLCEDHLNRFCCWKLDSLAVSISQKIFFLS